LKNPKQENLTEKASLASYTLIKNPIHVFISSHRKEFKITRKKIEITINALSLNYPKWIFKAERFEEDPSLKNKAGYFALLDAAAIYIVIIGHRFSQATIDEFERARSQNKTIIAYEFYLPALKKLPYKMSNFVDRLKSPEIDVNIRGHNPQFERRSQLLQKIADDLMETLGLVVNNYTTIRKKIAEINEI
jgi:hypothetical protein